MYLPERVSGMRMRKKPKVRLTPRKPILPDEKEIGENPRARSAKLRVCEKI